MPRYIDYAAATLFCATLGLPTLADGREVVDRIAAVIENDIVTLREHGFSDDQITVATQVIGYFNYITRIASGLGVDPESWMDVPLDEWHAQKGRDYLATLPTARPVQDG